MCRGTPEIILTNQKWMVRFVCLKMIKDGMERKIFPSEFRIISEPICGSAVQIHTTSVKTLVEKFAEKKNVTTDKNQ